MNVIILLAAVIAAVSAKRVPIHQPLSDEIINYVNFRANTTWKVSQPTFVYHFLLSLWSNGGSWGGAVLEPLLRPRFSLI